MFGNLLSGLSEFMRRNVQAEINRYKSEAAVDRIACTFVEFYEGEGLDKLDNE